MGGAAPPPPKSIPESSREGDLGKEIKIPALRGTQPSTWGLVLLLQPRRRQNPRGLLVSVAAHGSPRWHRRSWLHTDACVCLCMPARVSGVCVCVCGLQWPAGPLSIALVSPHGVQSGHQCQIIGSGGEESTPHPSSRQRGRGEGGANLPTALLIAHMPGHQEPAVTVETISALPSPQPS